MSMTPDQDLDLSIIIPMRNEGLVIDELFRALLPVLDGVGRSYEVICVNDGSDDDTLDCLLTKQKHIPVLCVVDLSRGFGKEAALTAGLRLARGKAVIVMDADLQHPPETIPHFIDMWEKGYEVVYGARRSRDRDSWLKRTTSQLFYAVFNRLSSTKIHADAGDFRLMDRCVVDALIQLPEHSRFMKGIFAWVGFKQIGVEYDCVERYAGKSQWSYFKLFDFAMDGVFSFSTVPLRLWTWVGTICALTGILYAAFLVLRVFVIGRDVPGFASIMVAVLVLGGVQLISIGVLGEYIGRIFRETKNRPLYIIRKTYSSEPR